MPEDDVALFEAIRSAHRAGECNDFYCGCWDSGPDSSTERFHEDPWARHTRPFLAALAAAGYEVVKRVMPWGKIHTSKCMTFGTLDPDGGVFAGDRDGGCICDGIQTYIRAEDFPAATNPHA